MKVKKLSLQTLRRFIPYLTAYAKDIWLAVLLGIINGIATVVMTLQIGQSIDQMIGEGASSLQSTIPFTDSVRWNRFDQRSQSMAHPSIKQSVSLLVRCNIKKRCFCPIKSIATSLL